MTKFPFGSVVEVRFLEGPSHWRAAQGKPSDRGARIQRYLSPTRQGLHNWGLNGPGWETHPRPPETPLRESLNLCYRFILLVEKNSMLNAKFECCNMGIATDPAGVPTVHFLMM